MLNPPEVFAHAADRGLNTIQRIICEYAPRRRQLGKLKLPLVGFPRCKTLARVGSIIAAK